jgi:hypothetical protein
MISKINTLVKMCFLSLFMGEGLLNELKASGLFSGITLV